MGKRATSRCKIPGDHPDLADVFTVSAGARGAATPTDVGVSEAGQEVGTAKILTVRAGCTVCPVSPSGTVGTPAVVYVHLAVFIGVLSEDIAHTIAVQVPASESRGPLKVLGIGEPHVLDRWEVLDAHLRLGFHQKPAGIVHLSGIRSVLAANHKLLDGLGRYNDHASKYERQYRGDHITPIFIHCDPSFLVLSSITAERRPFKGVRRSTVQRWAPIPDHSWLTMPETPGWIIDGEGKLEDGKEESVSGGVRAVAGNTRWQRLSWPGPSLQEAS